jgi:hypothetical protein
VLFYVALGVLFGLYLLAYRRVGQAGPRPAVARSVGMWALIFCLLLIPVQTITSSDVYGYTFQGRIVNVYGENPFVHHYRDFSADPYYFVVTFHNLPATTGYGPLWVAVEVGLGWLARDALLLNLLLYKGLAAACHLASAWLVYATLKRLSPACSTAGMLFYAWNPLLLHELVGNAHNDAAIAALALLGFYLVSRDRGLWAVPCLAAAALIKPVTLLWLPLLAFWLLGRQTSWRARLRQATAIGTLTLLPVVIAYAPFWAGTTTFRGVLTQSDIHGNSLPSLLVWIVWSLWHEAKEPIVQGVKLLTAVVFAPFYAWQLWLSRRDLLRASFDVMLFYLFFVGFQFMPWYLTWLMTPAALLPDSLRRRTTLILCVAATLLYFPFGWQLARTYLPIWAMAAISALPLLGLASWLGVRAWRARRSLN